HTRDLRTRLPTGCPPPGRVFRCRHPRCRSRKRHSGGGWCHGDGRGRHRSSRLSDPHRGQGPGAGPFARTRRRERPYPGRRGDALLERPGLRGRAKRPAQSQPGNHLGGGWSESRSRHLGPGSRKGRPGLGHSAERLILVEVPLDLRATLRPLGGRFLDDGWWTAVRTPQGPGTLRVRRTADGVEGTAWGPGADWLLGRLPLWVGLADPVEEFETEHPVVAPLARRHRGYRYGATGLVFEALIRAIVEQKVSGKEAAHSLRALWQRFGDPAPGPAPLRLPPDSERLAASPYWEYHRLG